MRYIFAAVMAAAIAICTPAKANPPAGEFWTFEFQRASNGARIYVDWYAMPSPEMLNVTWLYESDTMGDHLRLNGIAAHALPAVTTTIPTDLTPMMPVPDNWWDTTDITPFDPPSGWELSDPSWDVQLRVRQFKPWDFGLDCEPEPGDYMIVPANMLFVDTDFCGELLADLDRVRPIYDWDPAHMPSPWEVTPGTISPLGSDPNLPSPSSVTTFMVREVPCNFMETGQPDCINLEVVSGQTKTVYYDHDPKLTIYSRGNYWSQNQGYRAKMTYVLERPQFWRDFEPAGPLGESFDCADCFESFVFLQCLDWCDYEGDGSPPNANLDDDPILLRVVVGPDYSHLTAARQFEIKQLEQALSSSAKIGRIWKIPGIAPVGTDRNCFQYYGPGNLVSAVTNPGFGPSTWNGWGEIRIDISRLRMSDITTASTCSEAGACPTDVYETWYRCVDVSTSGSLYIAHWGYEAFLVAKSWVQEPAQAAINTAGKMQFQGDIYVRAAAPQYDLCSLSYDAYIEPGGAMSPRILVPRDWDEHSNPTAFYGTAIPGALQCPDILDNFPPNTYPWWWDI